MDDQQNKSTEETDVIEDAEVVNEENAENVDSDNTASETENTKASEDIDETKNEEVMYATPAANQASNLLNLESLINRYDGDLQKLREQMKTQRDMINDALNNDAEYSAQMQKVKEINRVKNGIKQRIMKQPAVAAITDKMNTLKDEIKDAQDALSSYLQEYTRVAKTNQIVTESGETYEIVHQTKLVRKSKYRP